MTTDTLYTGDNVAALKTFPDACIDLVVTSPPYDNLRTYGGHTWDFEDVARDAGRKYVGIEINPEYVEIINRRIGIDTSIL